MHTPKRRSASPHIGRLRPLNPSARTPLQSLLPCARRGHFAKRPMAVTCLGERVRTDGLSRWLAERTRRADQSPFARRTRRVVPVCPGEPAQAHRHDLGQTNPRYQTRRRDEPDCADQATKAAARACGIMAKRTGEAAPLQGGQKCQIAQNEPSAAARATPVPSPYRLNPRTRLLVENSPVFFLLFTGRPIFALAVVVPVLSLRKDQPAQSRRSERTRGGELTRQPGCFGRTNPTISPTHYILAKRTRGGSPVTPVAKQTQGAPSQDFSQTNPSGRQSARLRQTNPGATEPLIFPQTNPRCSPVPVWAT